MLFLFEGGDSLTALVSWGERFVMEKTAVAGVNICSLTLPRRSVWRRWYARGGARKLRELNIKTAVFVKDFPFAEIFAKYGVFPVDIRPLRLALAVPIVCAALREMGVEAKNAFVAVRTPRQSTEAESLVAALSAAVRFVSLDAKGGEALGERLRFYHGVSLREDFSRASLTLSLEEGEASGERILALFDRELHISYDFDAGIADVDAEELLALLVLSGLNVQKVAVLGIDASNLLTSAEKNSIMLCT